MWPLLCLCQWKDLHVWRSHYWALAYPTSDSGRRVWPSHRKMGPDCHHGTTTTRVHVCIMCCHWYTTLYICRRGWEQQLQQHAGAEYNQPKMDSIKWCQPGRSPNGQGWCCHDIIQWENTHHNRRCWVPAKPPPLWDWVLLVILIFAFIISLTSYSCYICCKFGKAKKNNYVLLHNVQQNGD